jgi:MoxR-like ATPase
MQTTQKYTTEVQKILTGAEILEFQKVIREVPVPPSVFEYTVGVVHKTRPGKAGADAQTEKYVAYGAGPRAGQYLILGAKCNALMKGKFSVDREDVMEVAQWVLPHRVVLNFKAEAEGIQIQNLIKGWL